MKKYRGIKYFLDIKDGLWKIILENKKIFVIALDDSKICGHRKIIWKNNNEKTCKGYIDFILRNNKNRKHKD